MSKQPNIVFFVADQMRSDSLHHLGNIASITPNLDKMVEEGVSYQNAYCQNPVCVPSRCSFLTGLYPHTTGHRTMHYLQTVDEPNILKSMKEAGYEVIWVGRNDVVPGDRDKIAYCDEYYDGSMRGDLSKKPTSAFFGSSLKPDNVVDITDDNYYSFYIGKLKDSESYGKTDWNCVQEALDYIDRKSQDKDGKPFFLYCTISFPHPPYGCEDPWYSSINRNQLSTRRPNIQTLKGKARMLYDINSKQNLNGWSEERFDELRATYLAMVSRFDAQFKSVCDKLKEHDFYDNSSIFVYSDHGDYTGDYTIVEKVQNCFENPISNVPLIVKPAKCFNVKPRISKALVELLDLPATIAEMAGITLNYTQFGESLLRSLAGDEYHKDAVICEGGRIYGEVQAMEAGHGPTSPYWPRLDTQCQEDGQHTKACMIRMDDFKYTMRLYEEDEFYDLKEDPYELNNAIHEEKYQEQIMKMRMRLLQKYMETSDYVPNRRDKR